MLLQKIQKTIKKHKLISPNDKIVIGVSGGPDSVCLLHVLWKLQKAQNLIVAHVNYGYRGKQADQDQKYVKNLAKRLGLKIYIKKLKINEWKSTPKKNIEAKFRKIRYDFFNDILQKEKANKIAVAHQADDQVETVIMFFLRGAGIRGLSGMSYRRNKIIRPLLDCSRSEILEYLAKNKLEYRKDVTNEDISFTRNRIRHKLIPYLEKKFNPNIKKTLFASTQIIQDDFQFIQEESKKYLRKIIAKDTKQKNSVLKLKLKQFLKLKSALQRNILRLVLAKFLGDIRDISLADLEETRRMLKQAKTGSLRIIKNLRIIKEHDKIVITTAKTNKKLLIKPILLKIPGKTCLPDLKIEIKISKVDKIDKMTNNVSYANLDKTGKRLLVRTKKKGDRFYPEKTLGSQKLKDFFINNKIPKREREEIPLIVTEKDQIVWICGKKRDRRFLANSKTKNILKMEIKPL